jgi:CheY-like chemotaxis protein
VTVARHRRILVVDDDALIRDMLAVALGDEGYTVEVAANGRAALDLLERWLPEVIVLDLMMPVMDGVTFRVTQQALPSAAAEIPVIVLSAAHEVRQRAERLQAAAVFAKPFDLGALLDAIALLTTADPPRAR